MCLWLWSCGEMDVVIVIYDIKSVWGGWIKGECTYLYCNVDKFR